MLWSEENFQGVEADLFGPDPKKGREACRKSERSTAIPPRKEREKILSHQITYLLERKVDALGCRRSITLSSPRGERRKDHGRERGYTERGGGTFQGEERPFSFK